MDEEIQGAPRTDPGLCWPQGQEISHCWPLSSLSNIYFLQIPTAFIFSPRPQARAASVPHEPLTNAITAVFVSFESTK